ncbi:MAG: hypothetical protein WBD48_17235, partial [Pseudolabrys sp.]
PMMTTAVAKSRKIARIAIIDASNPPSAADDGGGNAGKLRPGKGRAMLSKPAPPIIAHRDAHENPRDFRDS